MPIGTAQLTERGRAERRAVHEDIGPWHGVHRELAGRQRYRDVRGFPRGDLNGAGGGELQRGICQLDAVRADRQHQALHARAAEHAAVLENFHVDGRLNSEPAACAIRRDGRRRNHQRRRGAARHRHVPADGVVAGRHRDAVLTSSHVVQHERRHTFGNAIEGDLRAGRIRSDLEPSTHRHRCRCGGKLHILRDDTARFDGDGQCTRCRAARNLNVVGAWGKRDAQGRHPSYGAVNRDGRAVWNRLEVRGPGRRDGRQGRRRCCGRCRPRLPEEPAGNHDLRRRRPRQAESDATIALDVAAPPCLTSDSDSNEATQLSPSARSCSMSHTGVAVFAVVCLFMMTGVNWGVR